MTLDRFLRKSANLATILPAVLGPAVGGYAGRAIGAHYGNPQLGALLGGVTGGVSGQLLREDIQQRQEVARAQTVMPAGAPFALDPTSADIPAWAVRGAQLFKHSGLADVLGGDIFGAGWGVADGLRNDRSPAQIAKNVAGQTLGTIGGGFAGHAVGHAIDHLAGRQVGGIAGVPLSTLLAGLGATIGSTRGLGFANK